VIDIASVRLFDSKGPELTEHLPLVAGQTTRVIVRLYAADGHEITTPPAGLEVAFTFNASSFASSATVPDQVLIRDVTPIAAPGTTGELTVVLRVNAQSFIRSFGPFDALVHSAG
jgi:hypothetical protein